MIDFLLTRDQQWMQRAINLAHRAQDEGEVPVGAVVVLDNECIGAGWNRPIAGNDPTAHAEMVAIKAAAGQLQNYRLPGAELYVTLEPCVMCAGAIINGRIARVIYGAHDPNTGAAGSVFDILATDRLNHNVKITGGVMETTCATMLQDFFKSRR